ncbi:MAG: hypothetical protein QUV05_01820 [Phycisphaerae bacterium]|nr:hypothetical protein [Phycisphaerae bacterium]
MFYDAHTGNVTARIDRQSGKPDAKGSATTDPGILPLNTDPITEGRQRTDRNLRRAVRAFLCGVGPESAEVRPEVKQELLAAVRDNDGYGLTSWYFEKDGKKESPFSDLRAGYPRIWEEIVWQIAHP